MPQISGAHTVYLSQEIPADLLVLNGIIPLWCHDLGAFPVSQTVIGTDIELTYAGYPQYSSEFEILDTTDAVRTRQGGRLWVTSRAQGSPLLPMTWSIVGFDGVDTLTIDITDGNAPWIQNAIPQFFAPLYGSFASACSVLGNAMTVQFPVGLVAADPIELLVDDFGVTDANGRPLQAGSSAVP